MAYGSRTPGAVQYVDEVLGELVHQTPRAISSGELTAVHRARVATRRLGAALTVLSPLIEDHELTVVKKALRRIRRSVQELRDLDVMQEHLTEWRKRGRHLATLGRVQAKLAGRRMEAFHEVSEKAKPGKWLARVGTWVMLRGGLAGKREEINELLLRSLESQYGVFATQADRLAAGLAIGGHGEGGEKPIEPHSLRIAGKSLRYTFEMAQRQRLGVSQMTLRRFKQLQDALGTWHDYHVLTQRALQAAIDEMAGTSYHRDEHDLIALGSDTLRASEIELKRFGRLWLKHRDRIADELRKVLRKEEGSATGSPVEGAPVARSASEPVVAATVAEVNADITEAS